jgi:hypothetical protein
MHLGKTIFIGRDPKKSGFEVTHASALCELAAPQTEVNPPPRWFILKRDLWRDAADEPDVVLWIDTDTPADAESEPSPFLPSTVDGTARDANFDVAIVLRPKRQIGTARRALLAGDAMTGQTGSAEFSAFV